MARELTFLLLYCLGFLSDGIGQKRNEEQLHTERFTDGVYALTRVMFHDVINPPAAARFYAYSTLSAEYVVSSHFPGQSLVTRVNAYPAKEIPCGKVDPYFSAIYAMLETGKRIIPSGGALEQDQGALYEAYMKAGVKKAVLDSSVAYAERIGGLFAAYSTTDGYLSLSTLPRYQPRDQDSTWYPTPPEYMAAVEPHWSTIRLFLLDSAAQFRPAPPVAFDSARSSAFHGLMQEVLSVTQSLTAEQRLIANFWDCNPFANFYSGHVMIGIKKISPGGHWMGITGVVCRQERLGFVRAVSTHAIVAMGLHDAFISCWQEKYRSERIRPKTAINRYMDERWNPILETPPFPEYTSGHSVISTVSAELLTYLVGENVRFIDNTEVFFGLPERTFESFRQAADEAAISRLYGGIHYRDAIEEGQVQGRRISEFIINTRLAPINTGQ